MPATQTTDMGKGSPKSCGELQKMENCKVCGKQQKLGSYCVQWKEKDCIRMEAAFKPEWVTRGSQKLPENELK